MNKKIEILLDNAGGIQLQTRTFCHDYAKPAMAAQDIGAILEKGADISDWEGNDPDIRRQATEHDEVLSREELEAIICAGKAISRIASGYAGMTLVCELLGANAVGAIVEHGNR